MVTRDRWKQKALGSIPSGVDWLKRVIVSLCILSFVFLLSLVFQPSFFLTNFSYLGLGTCHDLSRVVSYIDKEDLTKSHKSSISICFCIHLVNFYKILIDY